MTEPTKLAPGRQGPLVGLRVIEVSSFVAAPLGGMTLAQLGADVIRIDPLGGAGDVHRWPLAPSGASMYWAGLNKGKRSISLDLKSAAGRSIVEQLLASCPPGTAVLLTNAVGRDWLGYEAMRAVRPDLIHVEIRGRSDGTPAVDYTVNAEVGFPMVTGPAGHADPVNHVLPAWDIACGLFAATGVAAAARHREVTGEGGFLTVALADVALAMAGNLGFLAEAQILDTPRGRIGNYLYGGFGRDFECADGRRVMVVALTNRHWHELVRITQTAAPVRALEDSLGADFSQETDRFEYREVLAGLFARWFDRRDSATVQRAMAETALLWAPYQSFHEAAAQLVAEGDAAARALVRPVDQPGIGLHLVPGCPLSVSGRVIPPEPAPVLAADTFPVLSERLHLSTEDLDRLVEEGVIASSASDPTAGATASSVGV